MSSPKLTEISLSVSMGGKCQIVKFENDQNYLVSASEKWTIPEDWTQEQVEEFRNQNHKRLRTWVDEEAQKELDQLMELRDELNG